MTHVPGNLGDDIVQCQALKARYAFLDLWESIYGDD